MMSINELTAPEIIRAIEEGRLTVADLVDAGVCPTCFDRENGHLLYGDPADRMIYEDEQFECFFVGNPRAEGHAAVSIKKHVKDMMALDDESCAKAFVLAKKLMRRIKEIYRAESVYLCTMCDGPMNHFHLQLIPRYAFEKRGSKNFVKPRAKYGKDEEKLEILRRRMREENDDE